LQEVQLDLPMELVQMQNLTILDVCISPNGVFALVADFDNHMIRHLDLSTSVATSLAGRTSFGTSNGFGTNAHMRNPAGIAISADNTFALIARRLEQFYDSPCCNFYRRGHLISWQSNSEWI
jgi:hypothetical protein